MCCLYPSPSFTHDLNLMTTLQVRLGSRKSDLPSASTAPSANIGYSSCVTGDSAPISLSTSCSTFLEAGAETQLQPRSTNPPSSSREPWSQRCRLYSDRFTFKHLVHRGGGHTFTKRKKRITSCAKSSHCGHVSTLTLAFSLKRGGG